MEGFTIPTPRTVEEVSSDFSIDMVKLYQTCHPEKDNLCLFGLPNETWKVNNLPDEEVPPEPALGINFARDGDAKKGLGLFGRCSQLRGRGSFR
ncbi:hypothetical protein IGI04_007917 [Brassica rapa subsp. trilocularis]|uniref:PHD finger protein ALFIN-LIKE n=1 Tax=Brassica rapa subsp. trilocularis TaxID=1813537 RepID=A0ABQ7NLG3_BRACM|nr:hypothetical protein IGI04_007917 [Brassica rapa subsp. trilocularis]